MKFAEMVKSLKERAEKAALRVKVDEQGFTYVRKEVAENTPGFYESEKLRRIEAKKRKLQEKLEKLEKEVN